MGIFNDSEEGAITEHLGYDISTLVAYFEAAYVVRRGETLVYTGTVPGPFDTLEQARSAAELAARGWIDRYAR